MPAAPGRLRPGRRLLGQQHHRPHPAGSGGANRAIFLSPTGVAWDVSAGVALDKVPVRRERVALPRAPPLGRATPPATACWRASPTTAPRTSARHASPQRQRGADRQPRRRRRRSTTARAFTLRGQLTGTNPTTIRVKAWTGTEPSTWQFIAHRQRRPAGRRPRRAPLLHVGRDRQRAAHADDRRLLGIHGGRPAAATATPAAATSAAATAPG